MCKEMCMRAYVFMCNAGTKAWHNPAMQTNEANVTCRYTHRYLPMLVHMLVHIKAESGYLVMSTNMSINISVSCPKGGQTYIHGPQVIVVNYIYNYLGHNKTCTQDTQSSARTCAS